MTITPMRLTPEHARNIGLVQDAKGNWIENPTEALLSPPPKDYVLVASPKRIRQSGKPVLNRLESEWLANLQRLQPDRQWHPQAVTFRLCNGARYTPDIVSINYPRAVAWEVKGPWATDDAVVKLKVAAAMFPGVGWWLAWKDKSGQWQTQEILP